MVRRIILKDLLYGTGIAILVYLAESGFSEFFRRLDTLLLVVVLLVVWLHKKTYHQAVKNLISFVRVLQVPVMISFLGLGIALYVNRYNTETFMFVMVLASMVSIGLSYKLLFDWTREIKVKPRINLEKYTKTLLTVVGLWLVAEGILLYVAF